MESITKEDLAKKLNGRQSGEEITDLEIGEAEENELVVIYGTPDDVVVLHGIIEEEVDAQGGAVLYIDEEGILPSRDDIDDEDEEAVEEYKQRKKAALEIKAKFDEDDEKGFVWTFKTEIPHAKFETFEEKDKFCRGIIIDMSDLQDLIVEESDDD